MTTKRFLTLAGAVAAFAAGSAYAQHDHGAMHGGDQHAAASSTAAQGIAEGTVQTYVKRIYEKMDVSTKAEAALLAVARGLVKP